ncbi:HD-GYP domain-containing protein [Clostridium sp. C2-6-12]|uniref:HD-GYP domain-containing protein n=1 Tax=Clostridium sp. C2-6-12 TaxID=2698832 RepID=UPI00136BD21F|nr:HD-GYP domain-containing protein [Clostridium sp. C2-6-12]
MGENNNVLETVKLQENLQIVKIDDLKLGMVIAQSIEISKNKTIEKDTKIEDTLLKLLQNQETLDEVVVYKTKKYYNPAFETFGDEESNPNEANNRKTTVADTVSIIEKSFNSIAASLNQTFFNLGNYKTNNMEEIRTISKQLQDKMGNLTALINDIVFYGSGADTIYRHSINVAVLCNLLGKWIGLEDKRVLLLTYSGLLHDIGKTQIDSKILSNTNPLSEEELKIVKSHPLLGYNIVKEINFLDKSVAQGILMHHERVDGSGYPLGLEGEKISTFGKIIGIADVFDAINSNRSYRKKKLPFEALEIIKQESFGKLDYNYCNIFLHHMFSYYVGKDVILNNDKKAQIIQMDINNLDRPLILLEENFIKLSEHKDLDIKEFVL